MSRRRLDEAAAAPGGRNRSSYRDARRGPLLAAEREAVVPRRERNAPFTSGKSAPNVPSLSRR
jgi:hypothetical protein